MYSPASILAGQRCLTVINMARRPVFDPDSLVPLYVQAADYITSQIASGQLPVGARLTAERELADQWGIAYQTVRRAMRELCERGLIASVVGKGTTTVPRRGITGASRSVRAAGSCCAAAVTALCMTRADSATPKSSRLTGCVPAPHTPIVPQLRGHPRSFVRPLDPDGAPWK